MFVVANSLYSLLAMSEAVSKRPTRAARFKESYDEGSNYSDAAGDDFEHVNKPATQIISSASVASPTNLDTSSTERTSKTKRAPKPPKTDPSTWRHSKVPYHAKARRALFAFCGDNLIPSS